MNRSYEEMRSNNGYVRLAEIRCKRWHNGQVRKYTGEPYHNHPIEVAKILADATGNDMIVVAGLLHDTIEDCGVSHDDIKDVFGHIVADFVLQVTDISKPSDGNRATRKKIDKDHLSKASYAGKTIKLADLISNTKSIVAHDKDFAKVYMKEKRDLLTVLSGGDEDLYNKAKSIVDEYFDKYGAEE